jgi:hypothetical protein
LEGGDEGMDVRLNPRSVATEIFLLEAKGDETGVRTRGRRPLHDGPLHDVRSLGGIRTP